MPSNPEMDRAEQEFRDWLGREMPRLTLITDSEWWASRIWRFASTLAVRQARAQWEQERGTPLTDATVCAIMRDIEPECEGWSDDKILSVMTVTVPIVRKALARCPSPAPDVRALQREAALTYAKRIEGLTVTNAERSVRTYCPELYPDPTPPSVTLCDVCGVAVPESPDGVTFSRHAEITDCVRNVAKRAALPPEDSTDGK